MPRIGIPHLEALARLYGVQTSYFDVGHQRQRAKPEALLAVLKCLGAPIESAKDVPDALRQRRQSDWKQVVQPVNVIWQGQAATIELRLPQALDAMAFEAEIELEDLSFQSWSFDATELPNASTRTVEGEAYVSKQLPLPADLPLGYHRLRVSTGKQSWQSFLICAPVKTFQQEPAVRDWGVFLPTYALRTQQSGGVGDFRDLRELGAWTARNGGGVVATLPLLAAFLDEPLEPSPYAPVSRLFWNELYVNSEEAAAQLGCTFQDADAGKRNDETRLVDYRSESTKRRGSLESMIDCQSEGDSGWSARLSSEMPGLETYARFRATEERRKEPWRRWPQRLQDGVFQPDDFDEAAFRYHLTSQLLAEQQLSAVQGSLRESGMRLYLDYPLGVHSDGFDTWRWRDIFGNGANAGAPPDTFFRNGQDWGFQPFAPEQLRRSKYEYVIASLRHHLRHADILRIDHIMGFHRLYWIPDGFGAQDGVYVHYAADELYAILCLESYKDKSAIVGEDLGTVPPYVRAQMARHGIAGHYVLQLEVNPENKRTLRPVPRNCVASLNTHDLPPFASYWRGHDIADRTDLGLLDADSQERERTSRKHEETALRRFLEVSPDRIDNKDDEELGVMRAAQSYLAESPAILQLVNLEDLWLEEQPQNVPGTSSERPNWQRRSAHKLEAIGEIPGVTETLQGINARRKSSNGIRQT